MLCHRFLLLPFFGTWGGSHSPRQVFPESYQNICSYIQRLLNVCISKCYVLLSKVEYEHLKYSYLFHSFLSCLGHFARNFLIMLVLVSNYSSAANMWYLWVFWPLVSSFCLVISQRHILPDLKRGSTESATLKPILKCYTYSGYCIVCFNESYKLYRK